MKPEELLNYLPAFPVYLIWLVGGIVALVRWHRHPRVSLIMLIATALFISGMLLNAVSFRWAVNRMNAGGWSTEEFRFAMLALSVVHSLFNAAAYTLLLIAVFGWRGGRRPGAEAEEDFTDDDTPRPRPPGA
jgi:hypothetical protein